MQYRYLDDFRRGISVFAIFSYGISVLRTPQCPPRFAKAFIWQSKYKTNSTNNNLEKFSYITNNESRIFIQEETNFITNLFTWCSNSLSVLCFLEMISYQSQVLFDWFD